MSLADRASHACVSCHSKKRGCDRRKPSCSTCSKASRACTYDPTFDQYSASSTDIELPKSQTDALAYGILPVPWKSPLDTLSSNEVNAIADSTAKSEGLALPTTVQAVIHSYFTGPHTRLPILEHGNFNIALVHAMYLLLQRPQHGGRRVASLLYLRTKSLIDLFEASEGITLQSLQARILVAYYEFGHGLISAAAQSVGACAKAARFLQLLRQSNENDNPIGAQEQRRTWWALFNLDRHVGLLFGDPMFTVPEPENGQRYPCEDTLWIAGSVGPAPVVGSSQEAKFGQFARECQISQLAARVVRNIFDPAEDEEFQKGEAAQLERTLMYFIPLLEQVDLAFGRYCTSLGICTSAMFLLCDHSNPSRAGNDTISEAALTAMEPIATLVANYAGRCYGADADYDYETLPPYVMLSVYQAAVVHTYLMQRSDGTSHYDARSLLQTVLRNFGRRWAAAEFYLELLESESPPLLPTWRLQ